MFGVSQEYALEMTERRELAEAEDAHLMHLESLLYAPSLATVARQMHPCTIAIAMYREKRDPRIEPMLEFKIYLGGPT